MTQTHEPQTITIDHVHALLQLDSDASVLGVIGGRVEAIDPQQLEPTTTAASSRSSRAAS